MTPSEQLITVLKNFWRCVNSGASADTCGYWLERFHLIMDEAERQGMTVEVNLPQFSPTNTIPDYDRDLYNAWPITCIKWGQHNGFTNQRSSGLPPSLSQRGHTTFTINGLPAYPRD